MHRLSIPRRWVHRFHELESLPWGHLLLANLWPAYLFAFVLAARIWAFVSHLSEPQGEGTPFTLAAGLQEGATLLFLSLVVLLFIVRKPLVGEHADWKGLVAGLGGTFLLNLVGFIPVDPVSSPRLLLLSAAVIIGGTAFTTWSLAFLGRCFGLLPEVRGLVTRGPYAAIRHPVYLGELISALGMVLAHPHPAIVSLYALFVILQFWRMHMEEKALTRSFPDVYPAYAARTGRLVPGWR